MGSVAVFVPHLGCPRRCSFCDQRAITGGGQVPTPDQVWDLAQKAAARLGQKVGETEIGFFGGSFTAIPRETMLALLEPGKQAVEQLGFRGLRCSTRPDAVDRETLSLLKEYHMEAVELGAQSMDDGVLALNRRGHWAADTARAAGLIRAAGMELGLQMMTGLYGSTPQKDIATARALVALQPDTVRIYPTVVLEHTRLAVWYRAGKYVPQTLEEAVALCARLLPLFEEAGVRVIRVGLHAQAGLEKRRVAGPYHPAFRELVESRRFMERLLPELEQLPPGSYRVSVCPQDLSVAVGQKGANRAALERLGYQVGFAPEAGLARGGFVVEQAEIQGREGTP